MTATSHLRFEWKQNFEDILREHRLIYQDTYGHRDESELTVSEKPILKAICDGGYEPREDSAEWFIVAFMTQENITPTKEQKNAVRFWDDLERSKRNSAR